MREIKFRFWESLEIDGKEIWSMNDNDGKGWYLGCNFYKGHEIPMQYTGLKDKNGKEIYEGDILTHKFQTCKKSKVVFFKGAFCYEDMDLNTHYFTPDAKFIKVVGNIYENPELIN